MNETPWTTKESAKVYHFNRWGSEYLSIRPDGNVHIYPEPEFAPSESIAIQEIVKWHQNAGGKLPAILRFPGILSHRVNQIGTAFRDAIRAHDYRGGHQICFPIKTNQRFRVVSAIRGSGVGLEVGTKSELLVGAAEVAQTKENLPLLCNGYKDRDYIGLSLMLGKAGIDITITLENVGEVTTLIETSKELDIPPEKIGLRVKLNAEIETHWRETSGPRGIFGLSRQELIWAVDQLKTAGLSERVVMLHYHVGSSVYSIDGIKRSAEEASLIYSDLIRKEKLENLRIIDVGGGLSLHYGESSEKKGAELTYSLQSYAETIVRALKSSCSRSGVPCPNIITESGRSVAAQHSILIFQAFGNLSVGEKTLLRKSDLCSTEFRVLRGILKHPDPDLDAAARVMEVLELRFASGLISNRELAEAERLFTEAASHSEQNARRKSYFGNLSVFQSLPDVWGIKAMFPVMPIHRLNEEPTVDAGISDITCDSDGRFQNFQTDGSDTIRLHPVRSSDPPYLIGVFDVGAYQEAIGDRHNLLAKTSVFSVRKNRKKPEQWDCRLEIGDESTGSVIESVGYIRGNLEDEITHCFSKAAKNRRISDFDHARAIKLLQKIVDSSPYLDLERPESLHPPAFTAEAPKKSRFA